MREMKMNCSNRYVVIGMLAGIVFLVYSSTYTIPYLFADDYGFLWRVVSDKTLSNYLDHSLWFASFGRPITGILVDAGFAVFDSLNSLRFLRIVTLVGFVTFAWQVYRSLRLYGWSEAEALFTVIAIVTLPSYQVYASWTQYYPIPLALILAFESGKRLWNQEQVAADEFSAAIILRSTFLFSLSMMVHQAAAMMFWLFPAIGMLEGKNRNAKNLLKTMIASFIVISFGCIMNIAIQKLSSYINPKFVMNERAALAHDIVDKVMWFIANPLTDSLNLHTVNKIRPLEIVVALIIVIGIANYYILKQKKSIYELIVVILIVPLAYMPNLLIAEKWSSYRTQVALETVILFMLVSSIKKIYGAISGPGTSKSQSVAIRYFFLISAGLIACGTAFFNVRYFFAVPQGRELKAMVEHLTHAQASMVGRKVTSICVVRSEWHDTLSKTVRYDEFGVPSTCFAWVPIPMIKLILRENGVNIVDMPKVESMTGCNDPEKCCQSCISMDAKFILAKEKANTMNMVIKYNQLVLPGLH